MTAQFRASDEDWQMLNKWADEYKEVPTYSCIRELRDRVMCMDACIRDIYDTLDGLKKRADLNYSKACGLEDRIEKLEQPVSTPEQLPKSGVDLATAVLAGADGPALVAEEGSLSDRVQALEERADNSSVSNHFCFEQINQRLQALEDWRKAQGQLDNVAAPGGGEMSNTQLIGLFDEIIRWLVELQNAANLNDRAWDEMGELVDRTREARAALEQEPIPAAREGSLLRAVGLYTDSIDEAKLVILAVADWLSRNPNCKWTVDEVGAVVELLRREVEV